MINPSSGEQFGLVLTGTIAPRDGHTPMTRKTLIHSRICIAALVLLTASAQAADPIIVKSSAQQTPVIELYTSEGCSSCPAADQWLAQLIQLPTKDLQALALAFHVDYWDYIGWKDRFANPSYSARQRHLARINQQTSVYTPEFFVNGEETRGTRRILSKVRSANDTPAPVSMKLAINAQARQLQLNLDSQFNTHDHPLVRFVVFEDNLDSRVKRGENAGRQLHHQHVVRYFSARQPLRDHLQHLIDLKPEWKHENLGVAALVLSENGEYLQSVYSLLSVTDR